VEMIWIILAASICGLDLFIKQWVEKNKELNCHEEILGGKIIVTKFYNAGAFLGMMKNKSRQLLGITLVAIGVISGFLLTVSGSKGNILLKLGLSLLLGGASSNAYERLTKGKVTDYFRINIKNEKLKKVIFNLGDMFVFLGGMTAIIGELVRERTSA